MQCRIFSFLIVLINFGCNSNPYPTKSQVSEGREIKAAKGVLKRILGDKSNSVYLELIPSSEPKDSYEYFSANGKLVVKGTSTIALARGMYDYLRSENLGMLDWSGPHFRLPRQWPDAPATRVTTPFRIRHAFNAVTSAYTTPYWTWDRWEQELDWQAMHGFNMLMAPVATEAIAARVWKQLGLTQEEINEFSVGPAHLPFIRMGCITQVGGSLPQEWHEDQIALQHKILKRMHELGIDPVIQSFAGFVPKALKRIYPDVMLHNTLWNAGFPPSQRPVLIMPDDMLFGKITKMYMEEWQKEFGTANYYLVDSFNEMELPKTGKSETKMLADYGEKTFNAIKSGAPDATWVIQGWMFAYQRNIWNQETVKALFSKIPDNRILILDYANDYNNNWQPMNAFNGKQWVYGFVPNMGGKTTYTGDLSLYAAGAARAQNSLEKKNLIGFTISGEGLENNTVIYELLTDVAWKKDSINLGEWLRKYSINRYGAYPVALARSWNLLRESCYSTLIPHPQFGWQLGQCQEGSMKSNPKFEEATLQFLSCSDELGKSSEYQADAIERAAITLGMKADQWFITASKAYSAGNIEVGDRTGKRGIELLSELDRLMESHPLNRLDRWLSLARSHSANSELQHFYESNARQIITVWGPPVNDYSCRIWSGLVRDFYRERMTKILESFKTGIPFNKNQWELAWVTNSGISPIKPYDNPIQVARGLVTKALSEEPKSH